MGNPIRRFFQNRGVDLIYDWLNNTQKELPDMSREQLIKLASIYCAAIESVRRKKKVGDMMTQLEGVQQKVDQQAYQRAKERKKHYV